MTEKLIEFILWLLIAASIIAIFSSRLRVPYTVALVLAGLALDLFHLEIMDGFGFSPEIILIVFLPALLFEAGININIHQLRRDLLPILGLAVVGVLVATGITGLALWGLGVMALLPALLFAALITATDPVSVLAILKELGINKRLTVLLEGESLLNDGTAIVLFLIFKEAILTGEIHIAEGVGRFILMAIGGAGLGLLFGYVASKVTHYIEDTRIEITLTTIVAYMSYLVSEHLHLSGVIATVCAGLMVGNYGSRTGMSARTRVALWSYWEYIVFVINSLIFLLIGLEVKVSDLVANYAYILVGIGVVVVARAASVYGLIPITNRLSRNRQKPIPGQWQHVLVWGGLHGTVSLALALTLPNHFPERDKILSITFGVVLFSLVAQGLTMKPLLKWLGIQSRDEQEFDRLKVSQMAANLSRQELERLFRSNEVSLPVYQTLLAELEQRQSGIERELLDLYAQSPEMAQEEMSLARMRLINAEKAAVNRAVADGILSLHSAEELIDEMDARAESLGGSSAH